MANRLSIGLVRRASRPSSRPSVQVAIIAVTAGAVTAGALAAIMLPALSRAEAATTLTTSSCSTSSRMRTGTASTANQTASGSADGVRASSRSNSSKCGGKGAGADPALRSGATSSASRYVYGTEEDTTQVGPVGPITVANGTLVDAAGRPVILHGVNVVYKLSPYLPSLAQFGQADVNELKALGFNFVRLGFLWEGMEPTGPTVDSTYLDQYESLVNLLTSNGIFVLVDAHQDLYGSYFGGEGAPDWAVNTNGYPYSEGSAWSLDYFDQPALMSAFSNFWANWDGIQTDYLDMWQTVAQAFANNPYVLGYDVMNEPFPGANYLSEESDTTTIEPFYKAAFKAIRAVDAVHTLYYENAITTNIGITPEISGLNGTDPNIALSDHVYCPYTQTDLNFVDSLCKSSEQSSFAEEQTVANDNGGAWLTTEMGATNDIRDIRDATGLADSNLEGWSEWAWKLYGDPTGNSGEQMVTSDTGNIVLEPKVTEGLERTYADAVAGTPTAMSFNPSTLAFSFTYTPDAALNSAGTDIFVPTSLYTKGAVVTVTGGTGSFSSSDPNVYVVTASGSGAVTVTIVNG
jgi:endoglycosylceramidase